jgi:hypothetical protein
MGADKTENEGFKVELFEYGYLVRDEDPTAKTFEIYVPKLQGNTTGSAKSSSSSIDNSSFANSSDSDFGGGNKSTEKGSIKARVSDEIMIAHRHSYHDCEGCPCPNKNHPGDSCHPVTGHLNPCNHFHHDHHWPHLGENGKVPANSRVIVLFMNHDINDAIVTRIECKFPGGGEPSRPRDRR